jgi:surface polysaccharide O-acyltransferase-like enzyme
MNNGKPKIYAIEVMRIISITAVLLIHTTTKILEASHYNLEKYQFTLFLNQFGRFAVPLFFLISGFVLEYSSDEKINYWNFIKRRFSKIVIPYIFWSLIYYFFVYTNNSTNLLTAFFTGNASYQLYFIPTICIFYLLFPLFHRVYKFLSSMPVITILTITQVYLMYQDYYIKQFSFPDPVRISLLGYLFFILGMIASRNIEKILFIFEKFKYFIISIIGILIIYIFNEGKSRYFETYDIKAFYSQWRPSVLIYTLLLFIFFLNIFKGKIFQTNLFKKISSFTYPVFFIHVFILEIFWRTWGLKIFNSTINNIIAQPIFDIFFFSFVVIVSFSIIHLFRKIPFAQKLIG